MHKFLTALNAFMEDTCVLVVVAFLLTRGRVLPLVFDQGARRSWRNALVAGLLLGAVGATEYVFPNQRYPYVPQTLFVTFAALVCGFRVGGVTALAILLASLPTTLGRPAELTALALSVVVSALVGWGAGRLTAPRGDPPLSAALVAGVFAQAGAAVLHVGVARLLHGRFSLTHALLGIPANGVGVPLLVLVVREARVRAAAERHRREAEQARLAATQHQLAALRARVHPHFLFNTLTSIAALCGIAPEKAEEATVQLGELMRRTLETDSGALASLAAEVQDVRALAAIERLRLGERLCIAWEIAAGAYLEAARVPPFALLTLLENAVEHGVACRPGPGAITLTVRPRRSGQAWVLCAVRDTGAGMTPAVCRQALAPDPAGRPHGLTLLDQQLRLLYGAPARLRLFSQEGTGTLAVFQVPASGGRL